MAARSAIWLTPVFLLIAASAVHAEPGIALTGDWSESVNSSALQSGAGSDFVTTQESAQGVGHIDISGTTGSSDSWRVDVYRVDSGWNGDLTLSVRRGSDGSGAGSISGGTSYQTVTGSAQTFFSGTGDRSSVDVQLRVNGVSVDVPVGSFGTTVWYAVVDTP